MIEKMVEGQTYPLGVRTMKCGMMPYHLQPVLN